jgi:hypothetical protein
MVQMLHVLVEAVAVVNTMIQVLILDQEMAAQVVAVQEVMYFLVEQIQVLQEQLTLEEVAVVEFMILHNLPIKVLAVLVAQVLLLFATSIKINMVKNIYV